MTCDVVFICEIEDYSNLLNTRYFETVDEGGIRRKRTSHALTHVGYSPAKMSEIRTSYQKAHGETLKGADYARFVENLQNNVSYYQPTNPRFSGPAKDINGGRTPTTMYSKPSSD